VADLLMQAGIECFRIQFPKGMDANDYALKVTPASHSLGLVIRKAVWLGNGKPPVRLDVKPVSASMPIAPEAAAVLASEPSSLVADLPVKPVIEPPALPASPIPAMTPAVTPCEIHSHEIIFNLAPVRYRVRGFDSKAGGNLRVNLLASSGDAFFVDTVDLYNARQRATFMAKAASELRLQEDALKADLGRILLQLELLQSASTDKAPGLEPMTVEAQREALALLNSPDLTSKILADFAACGLVGEETNKLVAYLATVSRKLDKPLGIVIQSSSAAGKSSLMDAVLAFVPAEDKVKYSAMTGQSLFYMGETNLKNKALAIVEEEGASRASYALKLLQSEGELTIASTGKDPVSGNLITQQYRVEGPVALLVTTTARDIDEELMNRCLVLSVDEGREQTRAIHQLQRDKRTLQGLIARREKESLITLHQNAQRLLKPLAILNPFTQYLTFPDQTTRLRRDHEKYLTLIDTIAFLHQHQREIKTATRGNQNIEYIEVSLADIDLGNRIAHEVLGRSLDELPPQTRRLMKLVDQYVMAECARQNINRADFRFSRRALREAIHWGDTQLKIHLARLTELEYLVAHRTKTGGFDYELVYDVPENSHTLRFPGLADIDALKCAYDVARSGQNASRSGAGRPVVGGQSGTGRDEKLPAKPIFTGITGESDDTDTETHLLRVNTKIASYPQPQQPLPLAAAQG